jgi:hypothetical protein
MPEFIPGLELAGLYYHEAVEPILDSHYPGLVHSAGLSGGGSEVLGFDDAMSTDHSWGPRLLLFLSEPDHARLAGDLHQTLAQELPFSFRGYSTHFEAVPNEPGAVVPAETDNRPINHTVRSTVLSEYLLHYVGTPLEEKPTILDWLTIPGQKLRSLVAGAVFHDGLGVLGPMQRKLAYYPHDVWLYLLSAQWRRIWQEEPFVGRAGSVGDEVGSAIIAARLVRDLMHLCMLMEKQYVPYPKWFGSAFAQLACADQLGPVLEAVLASTGWQEREGYLCAAYEIAATMHNDLGVTEPVQTKVRQFHDRPFRVIEGEEIAKALWDAIQDPEVRALPYGVGKIDQYVDSTDILSYTERSRRLDALYSER